MKTLLLYPPNIDIILASGLKPDKKTIFCYENTIYNPQGIEITSDLEHHESIHAKQQAKDSDGWWFFYLKDKDFRLEQELEAYAEQFIFFKRYTNDRKLLEWLKEQIAFSLSSEIYKLNLSYGEAESKLRNKIRQITN